MKKEIIRKYNTGIGELNLLYNTEFKNFANRSVYIEGLNVIVEDCGHIEINTNIKNKEELDSFIDNIKKTDLVKIFSEIELIVSFKDFVNCPKDTYFTILHGESFIDKSGKIINKEYCSVFIKTSNLI